MFRGALYRLLGVTLPKFKDQQNYWRKRGKTYIHDFLDAAFVDRETFFQDMLIDHLRTLQFDSAFEAGCGFGWNLKRLKTDFPHCCVGGVDFSLAQLDHARHYLAGLNIDTVCGDNCTMPLGDNAYDVGFSVGVFMNIHPDKIEDACKEMVRVSRKYIFHIEYDQRNTTEKIHNSRITKRNIISHDYCDIYKNLGCNVVKFLTHKNFGQNYLAYQEKLSSRIKERKFVATPSFEGAGKYVFVMVELAA